MRTSISFALAVAVVGCTGEDPIYSTTDQMLSRNNGFLPNGAMVSNSSGKSTTISTNSAGIDLTNEFFQDLGSNGRRCVSCHLPSAGWTVTPEEMQATFDKSDGGVKADDFGLGAAFRLNDGANSPNADVSTLEKRRAAYSMLLTKGLIRVGIGIRADAEFELIDVDANGVSNGDPYHYASANELSLFRRPLPTTNLKFLSAVMWDGRETFAGQSIHFDLSDQANGATLGHAAATNDLSDAQRESIVNFEVALHTAQESDNVAGDLTASGGGGGAANVIAQVFYIGINDLFGDSRTGAPFTTIAMTLYDGWANSNNTARQQIARGQKLFNTKTIHITGVSGINDEAIFGFPTDVAGTCTVCHDAPNAGDHSVAAPLDIGLVAESERTPDMPLYTLRNKTTGEIKKVTDPGRALITGKWNHIGRFKGPILRGLAARAPYFHNGSAKTLEDAVNFYDRRFHIGFTAAEKADLVAFLKTL